MYTRCSHCHSVCEVSPEALALGRGRLQCPRCGRDFDALENLTSDAPRAAAPPSVAPPQGMLDLAQPDAHEPAPPRTDALVDVLTAHADFIEPLDTAGAPEPCATDDAGTAPLTGTPGDIPTGSPIDPSMDAEADIAPAQDTPDAHILTPTSGQESHDAPNASGAPHEEPYPSAPAEEARTATTAGASTLSDDPGDIARDAVDPFHPVLSAPTPSFIPDTTPTPPVDAPVQRRWPRWLAVAALLLLLIGQSIHAERDLLAADARWRPWLERACASIGCTLPAWHDPAAMRLMTRDVRPHPSVSDALLISASFRNDAPWAQQWPRLHLSLSDLNGQTIAQREFAPDQYLGMTARDLAIQPGQTASVTLEVRDPGKQAVAFEFDFR